MGTLQTTFRCWGESEPSSDKSDDSDGDGEMSCVAGRGLAEETKEMFVQTYLLGRGEVTGPVSYSGCTIGEAEGGGGVRCAIERSGGQRCCRTRRPGLGGRGGSAWCGGGAEEEEEEEEEGVEVI